MNKWMRRTAAVCVLLAVCIFLYVQGKDGSEADKNASCSLFASQTMFAMDTYMELTAYGAQCEEAIEAAQAEIERLDALLSTGSDTSEVTRLNIEKTATVSEDVAYLWQRSYEIYQATDGAFDVTIYPVMRAWGFTDEDFKVPSAQELTTLLKDVDSSLVSFDADTQTLTLPQEVEIDFGGIAKGYTSERVAEIMRDMGVESAILNLGGNVQTIGTKPDGSAWRVAIKDPNGQSDYLGVVSVTDKAVITSGGYERYFEQDGVTYHHIIDPQTGAPADNGLQSVTIVSADGTLADGLSTALYVMGTDDAIAYWRMCEQDFDAILYTDDGTLYVTAGLAEVFSSEREITVVE